MPYNILLLPLLAGFLFIARARIISYATSQLQKEQLLLWASLAGLVLLLMSRIICVGLIDTPLGQPLLELKRAIAPFPYMGTAIGTLLLSAVAVWLLNCLIPEGEAGLWLYHAGKFNQLESILLSSALGVPPAGRMSYAALIRKQLLLDVLRFKQRMAALFARRHVEGGYSCFAAGDPQLVMVTLSDDKIYVGLVAQLPPVVASKFEFLRILPVWSGFRDSPDRRVYRTTDYESAVLAMQDKDKLIKVVPAKDIVAVGLYIDGTFPIADHKRTVRKPVAKRAPAPRSMSNSRARAASRKD